MYHTFKHIVITNTNDTTISQCNYHNNVTITISQKSYYNNLMLKDFQQVY